MELGTRLSELLKNNQIQQKQFAKYIGVQEQTVGRYIKGTSQPNAEVIIKMVKVLNVSADYLLGTERRTK